MKQYQLNLPVFKQGDDLGFHLEKAPSQAEALNRQAETYEEAARICRRAAGVVAEGDMKIDDANVHFIFVSGNPARLEALEKDGLLNSTDWDDEEEDETAETAEDEVEEADAPDGL